VLNEDTSVEKQRLQHYGLAKIGRLPNPVQAVMIAAALAGLVQAGGGCGLGSSNSRIPPHPTPPALGGPVTIQEALIRHGYISGHVQRMTQEELVLKLTSEDLLTLRLTSRTQYIRAGRASSWNKLQAEEEVWVKQTQGKNIDIPVAKTVLSQVDAQLPLRNRAP
jgi:hypothetical protein